MDVICMGEYEMGLFVMNHLQRLGLDMIAIGEAITDENLHRSYRIIKDNPNITINDFLKITNYD